MRNSFRALAVVALVLTVPGLAAAQARKKPQLGAIRVGFPVGSDRNRPVTERGYYKSGAWTPVYIDLTAGEAGLSKAQLVIETSDTDDVPNTYSVPVPRLAPHEAAINLV